MGREIHHILTTVFAKINEKMRKRLRMCNRSACRLEVALHERTRQEVIGDDPRLHFARGVEQVDEVTRFGSRYIHCSMSWPFVPENHFLGLAPSFLRASSSVLPRRPTWDVERKGLCARLRPDSPALRRGARRRLDPFVLDPPVAPGAKRLGHFLRSGVDLPCRTSSSLAVARSCKSSSYWAARATGPSASVSLNRSRWNFNHLRQKSLAAWGLWSFPR